MQAVDEKNTVTLRVIRTDTAVNSGNSGGGLFNDQGKLIGIVNAKISDSSVENIAYAIPANVAKAIADNIIYNNRIYNSSTVMRVMLGVTIQTGELRTELDSDGFLVKTETAVISDITSDSIVKDILQIGDVLQSVKIGNNYSVTVTRSYQFIDALLNARVDDEITIVFSRNGTQQNATFKITQNCISEY